MKRLFIAFVVAASVARPGIASASVLQSFFPTTPSTNSLATISFSGNYAFPLPNPSAAPFLASPFLITATIPAQFYAPYGIGTGLVFTGVSGSYTNDNVIKDFANATLELEGEYVETFSGSTPISLIEETFFNLSIGSLLNVGDNYDLNMVANNFLYTEQDPVVTDPLAAPAPIQPGFAPAIVTILPGSFSALSGGLADYTSLSDPQDAINAGGTGLVSSQLPVPVPEPSSGVLLASGILLLGLIQQMFRRAVKE